MLKWHDQHTACQYVLLLHVSTPGCQVQPAKTELGKVHMDHLTLTSLKLAVCSRRGAAVELGRQHHMIAVASCPPRLEVAQLWMELPRPHAERSASPKALHDDLLCYNLWHRPSGI